MLMELLATVVLGFSAAGVVLIANRWAGGGLPGWTMPVVAGLAMLSYQIWSEYTWFERTAAALPPGIEVTASHEGTAPWRPWTYLAPQVVRFAAVDVAGARRHERQPGQVLADILLFSRHAPIVLVPHLIDCPARRRASLIDGAEFDADGQVIDPAWIEMTVDDPMLGALCRPEELA